MLKNYGLILVKISKSRKNKEPIIDDNYTKSVIEFLGMYLFSMLIRSYDVPKVMKGNMLKKLRRKKENEIVTNISLAKLIVKIGKSQVKISPGVYKPGELIDWKPISFDADSQSSL